VHQTLLLLPSLQQPLLLLLAWAQANCLLAKLQLTVLAQLRWQLALLLLMVPLQACCLLLCQLLLLPLLLVLVSALLCHTQ
jgi:hypothetical protein